MTVKIKNTGLALLKSIRERKEQSLSTKLHSSTVDMTKEECKSLCTKIGLEFRDGFEKRVVEFRFTDATADRHNEVVNPSGVDLKSFKKDPVILLQHDAWRFPIGKSLETTFNKETNDVTGKILFFDDEIDRSGTAEDTFRMVTSGAMKNGSIGFNAKSKDIRLASPEEREKFGLEEFGVIFDKIELREFSIVTIPANPNATQVSSRKGLYREDTLLKMKEKGLSDEHYAMLLADVNSEEHPLKVLIGKGKEEEDPESEDDITSEESTDEPSQEDVPQPTSDEPEVEPELENNENTEEEPEPDTSEEDEPSEAKNFEITLLGTDSDAVKTMKLKLCEMAIGKGHNVSIKENFLDVSNTPLEKAGAVLSKKNKGIIETTLESIDSLKTQLTDLLKSATSSNEEEDSEDVKNNTPSDDAAETALAKLYDVTEKLSDKIKPITKN